MFIMYKHLCTKIICLKLLDFTILRLFLFTYSYVTYLHICKCFFTRECSMLGSKTLNLFNCKYII